MIANTFTRLTFSTLVALLLPVIAAAQTSIFVVPLDRTGTPGTRRRWSSRPARSTIRARWSLST